MIETTFQACSIDDLNEVAEFLGKALKIQPIAVFKGDLGSGKTTLIKQICAALGSTDLVSSPTFSLVNEYLDGTEESIYHFDLFRIEDRREALDFGLLEYLESDACCLIEWPEKISRFLPENHIQVKLSVLESNCRKIHILSKDG